MLRITTFWVLLSVVITAIGCSKNDSNVNQVTGIVTMDSQPLANARVSFMPANGRPSQGVTTADGTYKLYYIRAIEGAEPGTHKVSITTEPKPNPVSADGVEREVESAPEKIPAKYNRNTSLTAEVKPGPNVVNFDLESK